MQIGFIGAGFMGYGIAHNLLKAGHSLRVIANRKRENIERLVSQGATEAQNYVELLSGAEAAFSCVGTAEQILATGEQQRIHDDHEDRHATKLDVQDPPRPRMKRCEQQQTQQEPCDRLDVRARPDGELDGDDDRQDGGTRERSAEEERSEVPGFERPTAGCAGVRRELEDRCATHLQPCHLASMRG